MTLRIHQIRFSTVVELTMLPQEPPVGWELGYSFPIPHPLDAYGASFSAPAEPHLELGRDLLQRLRGDRCLCI